MNQPETISVLFVCLGNICRSPMAEAIFRHEVHHRGLEDHVTVQSTGTGSWHIGRPPHEGTRDILDAHHISYEGQLAQRLEGPDIVAFDYIIAMDRSNVHELVQMGVPKQRIELLTDYAKSAVVVDVPDPYYHHNFDEVYDLIAEGVKGLLNRIVQQRLPQYR